MPTVTVNGVDLFYDLAGSKGLPTVAFSNSLGSTIEMWDGVAEALAGRFRVLRYDAQGHGRSGARDEPTTIDDLADDLAGLLDALDIRQAHVVGLSLGGMTAQAFAVLHPERTASLVLMATAAHLPPPDFWRQRAATVIDAGPEAVVDTIVPRWFTPGFQERNPEAVRHTRDSFLESDRRGYARCCEAIADMDLRQTIRAITAPTLVMVGADDPVAPLAMGEDIRSRIAGAELVVAGRLRPPDVGRTAGGLRHPYRRLPRTPRGRRPDARLRRRARRPPRRAGRRPCRPFARQCRRLRHALAGFHHAHRLA